MGQSVSEIIEFLASFPPIQSAIKIDGQGGARIQLDVPEDQMGAFIKAMMWRGMRIKVKFELEENPTKSDDETKKGAEGKSIKLGRRGA